MSVELIRLCPGCGTENAAQVMRCRCGARLAGIDLIAPAAPAAPAAQAATPVTTSVTTPVTTPTPPKPAPVRCGFDDCGQANPPDTTVCLYCNRPIEADAATPPVQPLINLPGAVKKAYRILQAMPSQGGEAELMLVEPLAGGPTRVAKIYRFGLEPKAVIHERLARVDAKYRVNMIETGYSEGYFYEIMAYCALGSWRVQLQQGALHEGQIIDFVEKLAPALAAIHALDLIHRDLKPDNILVQSLNPLHLLLTDFGSASVLDATQRFTSAARTLFYAAPESLSGVLDVKADYWALGMMVLEAALGQHPFAGLSEAVILHHLTTRSVDLSGVPMRGIVKLLRGLLVRDPKLRWGGDEVKRWLANDPSLPEMMDASANTLFHNPYHLGKEICHSSEQLASAMARNWKLAQVDSENGQLMAWFRDVQKDQNTVRLLLEMKFDRPVHVDLRLLKLILHLAPGISPVWQGEALDLRAVLSRAALALKDDNDAIDWLDLLYRQGVLGLYAELGHQASAALMQRWSMAYDQFVDAWDKIAPLVKAPPRGRDEFVHFDDVIDASSLMERRPLALMHARLLASAYDAGWVQRLRQRLEQDMAGLMVDCPWLAKLPKLATLDGPALLALECLIPMLKKIQQSYQRGKAQQQAMDKAILQTLQTDLTLCLQNLQANSNVRFYSTDDCDDLRNQLDRLLGYYTTIRATASTDPGWQKLERDSKIKWKIALDMRERADVLYQWQVVNNGWFNQWTWATAGIAMLLAWVVAGPGMMALTASAAAGVVAWRLMPTFTMVGELKEMASRLLR
jgi:serine/threonine protein kinase